MEVLILSSLLLCVSPRFSPYSRISFDNRKKELAKLVEVTGVSFPQRVPDLGAGNAPNTYCSH